MSSWLDTIDPDVRQVLEDVTKDRKSKLFRLDRSRPARAPFAEIEPVSARSAGWRPAERHLLETYREEVWLLVHAACYLKTSLDEDVSSIGEVELHRYKGQRLTKSEVADRSSSLASSSRLDDLQLKPRGLLQQFAEGHPPQSLEYGAYATAARQLYDSDSTRLLAAHVANIVGQHEDAEVLARPVAQRTLRSDMGYSAWSILGYAQSHLRETSPDAARSFQRALAAEPGDLPMAANAMMASVQAGAADHAIELGRIVDGLATEDRPEVIELIRQYSVRHAAMHSVHRCDPDALQKAHEALGSTSRAILNAVFR